MYTQGLSCQRLSCPLNLVHGFRIEPNGNLPNARSVKIERDDTGGIGLRAANNLAFSGYQLKRNPFLDRLLIA